MGRVDYFDILHHMTAKREPWAILIADNLFLSFKTFQLIWPTFLNSRQRPVEFKGASSHFPWISTAAWNSSYLICFSFVLFETDVRHSLITVQHLLSPVSLEKKHKPLQENGYILASMDRLCGWFNARRSQWHCSSSRVSWSFET